MVRLFAAIFGASLILGTFGPVAVSAARPTHGTVTVSCTPSGPSRTADAHAQRGLEKAVNNFNEHNPSGKRCSLND
jgi:ABC-type glycerol-3-phosphate transport system substrate-binding protein